MIFCIHINNDASWNFSFYLWISLAQLLNLIKYFSYFNESAHRFDLILIYRDVHFALNCKCYDDCIVTIMFELEKLETYEINDDDHNVNVRSSRMFLFETEMTQRANMKFVKIVQIKDVFLKLSDQTKSNST